MSEPIACSLDSEGMQERGREIAGLHAIAATRTDTGISLLFAAETENAVRDLARREAECCPFLDLRVSTEPAGVRLDISGPGDAQPIVDAFLSLSAG